ncbi:MAG TPA: putative quinol monooxygenase [Myxococcota bacterium]|jgi:quinol monooxygenase YgiN|nr:putative quinol monooxygenase [Myxococcota bacterium]
MIVIAGSIRIDPAQRERAAAAAREMMEATRRENGCRAYVFSFDVDDPGLVHLFEHWDSAADLQAHFTAPHMARFQAAIAGLVRGTEIQRYEVSSVGPMRR